MLTINPFAYPFSGCQVFSAHCLAGFCSAIPAAFTPCYSSVKFCDIQQTLACASRSEGRTVVHFTKLSTDTSVCSSVPCHQHGPAVYASRLLCIACFEQSQLEGKASSYAEPKGRGMLLALLFQPDIQMRMCNYFADHCPWIASNLVQRHVFVCGRVGVQEQSQRVMTYTRG